MSEYRAGPDELDALAVAAQGGDREAYGELVKRTQPSLRAFLALRLVDLDLLEEVEQAAYVQAWLNLARYEPRGTFLAWICGFGRNLAAKQLRQRYRQVGPDAVTAILLQAEAETDDALEEDLQLERRDLVHDCLADLAPTARKLIHDRYFHGREVADLATEQGRSNNWVSVTLMRIRGRLRDCLQAKGVAL